VIRILIAARSPIVQAGLEAMITREPTLQIVGRITALAALESSLGSGHPDAIVLEAALLTDTHLKTLAVLQQEVAIALLVAPNESYSATTLLPLGVKAILPINVTADELILTVEAISVGLIVLHPDVSDALLQELPSSSGSELPPNLVDTPLTPRELELLQLLATGLGNKAIARQMNISEHTAKFHISSIFCKLNASSRTEAVMLGMRLGLIFF
jgi:two-component system, NarL family, response regulator YdfI